MSLWTDAFTARVAPARKHTALWRLAAALVAIQVSWSLANACTNAAIRAMGGPYPTSPERSLIHLTLFATIIAATLLAARVFHGRKPSEVVGDRNWGDFRTGLAVAFLTAFVPLLFLFNFSALPFGLPPTLFLSLFPFAVAAIALQTGAEELWFRGFMQSQIAARFSSAWAWMVFPAAYFALTHVSLSGIAARGGLDQTELNLLVWTFAFGLMTADIVRVSGNLMAAWGWHLGINMVSILLVSGDGILGGLSLYYLPAPAGAFGIEIDPRTLFEQAVYLLLVTTGWAILRLHFSRR